MLFAWTDALPPPTLLPLIRARNSSICYGPLTISQSLASQDDAINWKRDGWSLVHLDFEGWSAILFDTETVPAIADTKAVMPWQTCLGQLQAVLQSAELVGLYGVVHDFLTIGINECESELCPSLCLWCLVVTLGISNAANIDHLSWTINAAVGIDTEMVSKFVVVVVISTPA